MSYVNKSLQKKDAMALVTGKPVIHRRPGTKGLPDHQDIKESLCQCLGGRDQDGHSHESRRNCTDPYLGRCSKEDVSPLQDRPIRSSALMTE